MSNPNQPPIIAHLDCSTGVSGDKFLSALLDAGSSTGQFTVEYLAQIAHSIAPEVVISLTTSESHGLRAKTLTVTSSQEPPSRSYTEIKDRIRFADIDERVIERTLGVFESLAEAESTVHGVAIEDVHFHELGSIDTIVDIVGVCAGLDALDIAELYAAPPALGSGTITTSHGQLAVPAPATATILATHRIPTTTSTAVGELTTPTGAALLTLVTGFGPVPPMSPYLLGYGAGTRDIGQPNVCRLLVGELNTASLPLFHDDTTLLETNIDHITPEAVAFAGEELLAEGALDVWITPIAMKKGRAALTLSVLVDTTEAEKTAARIVDLTGTLGVRVSPQSRLIAQREIIELDTPWGMVACKFGAGRYRPEHEDIARIARTHSLGYNDVLVNLMDLINQTRLINQDSSEDDK